MRRSISGTIDRARAMVSRQMIRNRTRLRRADFVLTTAAICWLLFRFFLFAARSQR